MKRTLLASVAIAALATISGAGPAWAVVALEFSKLDTAPAGFDASAEPQILPPPTRRFAVTA